MNTVNQKIIDAVIEKANKICPESLALIGVYGSVATGDEYEKSDLDLLILIEDNLGWSLGTGFILEDSKIGYDIYCTNWDRLRYDSECHHAHLSKLMDSDIVYIKKQEAYEALCKLREKTKKFLESEERFAQVNELIEKAKLAYEKADLAVNEENEKKRNDIWREIFGNQFPCISESIEENRDLTSNIYTDHEEFIENKYLVDIRYDLKIDCVITRNGFREALLSALLAKGSRISRIRSLDFTFHTDAPEPYEVKWKARNVGIEAEKRNCLRGEIINSNRKNFVRHEIAEFLGPHYMECYIIKDGIVIARDRIDVPID